MTAKRILLARRPGSLVEAHIDELPAEVFAASALADFVRTHEPDQPRWVWDDTISWYPELLRADVTVRRCVDLRLCHNILRSSPFIDQSLLVSNDTPMWDALQPFEETRQALFSPIDLGDALDPVVEDTHQQAALRASTHSQRLGLLLTAESAGALAAEEMTHVGLPWSTEAHLQLLVDKLGERPAAGRRPEKLEAILDRIRVTLNAPKLNPDSPGELLTALHAAGIDVPDTRSWRLKQVDHPVIPDLLQYKKLTRLLHANGWQWIDTWIKDDRFRTQLLVGAVVTGRWAARGGGALQFPVELRRAVIADPGWKLVVADVAQLEPRVLAGCSADRAMAQAASATDLYEGMVAAKAVATRNDAKLGLLGAMYGATRGEGGRMMERMTQLYPDALAHVENAARAGERGDVVHTLLGRGSPRPDAEWVERSPDSMTQPSQQDAGDRRAWGRFTRNFVIQGTGAEWALCWIADIRRRLHDLDDHRAIGKEAHLVFFLHDEVVIHTPAHHADAVAREVREGAVKAGRLLFGSFPVDFPLDVAVVDCWADA